ncbi:MAG: DUF3769 domain-containing protein [Synechococcales cyanobacterium M58_A2018_015]|nr:DUF3769 domain-containing protein [Synechococcales cyanobacterium M58_A2018_015]
MPYPVPPPLPPVVNIVLPEDSHLVTHSLAPARASLSQSADLPVVTAANCLEGASCAAGSTAETPAAAVDSVHLADAADSTDPTSNFGDSTRDSKKADTSPAAAPESAPLEAVALTAEALGAPLTLQSAGVQSRSPAGEVGSPRLRVVSLPELDRLAAPDLAETSPLPRRSLDRQPPGNAAGTHVRPWSLDPSSAAPPTATGHSAGVTLTQHAIPADLAERQPATPPENPPLYTPEFGEETPPADPMAPNGNLEPEQTPSLPPLPTPEPAPGGEILIIPTPDRPRDGVDAEPPTELDRAPAAEDTPPGMPPTPPTGTVPIDPMAVGEVLEVTADRQEFNEREQIFYAEGNVLMRFRRGTLAADRVRVNIPNRVAIAEGNAVLTRGEQTLFGQRFEYNFGLNQGNIIGARGEIFVPAVEQDFDPERFDTTTGTRLNRPVTQQVSDEQNLQVFPGAGGINFGVATPNQTAAAAQGGDITQFRFEAETAEFDGDRLIARNVRITNDPFSPPELEFRANELTYTRLNQFQAEIRARNPRVVFDQGLTLPLPINRQILDNRERQAGLVSFGFDQRDRDGFYIERVTPIYSGPNLQFTVTPQVLVQRAFDSGNVLDPSNLGLVARLDAFFGPNTSAEVNASFSSLDFAEVGDNLRASIRARQQVLNHTVALEYSYRDRLFNGSLGFQDVQSSLGLVVTSPRYVLGDTGINLIYQGSMQYVNAATDQPDLFPADRAERNLNCINPDDRPFTGFGCADLMRYQATATLSRFFLLWSGTALPPTPDQGLRYSPFPITPYVGLNLETRGVFSAYSNGDSQSTLRGGVSLLGQFGRLARQAFDYTAFNVTYYQTLQDGNSPFLFDRNVDEEVLEGGITQQIYGPLLFGVRTSYNLDTGDNIDTILSLEYRRRTYSLSLSYSTRREAAALSLRINDFNWLGDPGPFSGLGARDVEGGAIRESNE